MRIVIMIPAFNEALVIHKTISAIPTSIIPGNEVVTVVIDDGSIDETASIAKKAGAIEVIRHSNNMGVGQAFKSGVSWALENNADVIVNIDADGQFSPDEIPLLVNPIIQKKADVVIGSRFIGPNSRNIPLLKRLGNMMMSLLVSLLSGKRFTDTQSGFRAFSRNSAASLSISGIFTYTQEALLCMAFKGYRVAEVPVSVRYFNERKSRVVTSLPKYAFKALGNILLCVFREFKYYFIATILVCLFIPMLISLLF